MEKTCAYEWKMQIRKNYGILDETQLLESDINLGENDYILIA